MLEGRRLTCKGRPAPQNHFTIDRVKFNAARHALRLFASDQRRAGPGERVEHQLMATRAILNRVDQQCHRLHRRVQLQVGLLLAKAVHAFVIPHVRAVAAMFTYRPKLYELLC